MIMAPKTYFIPMTITTAHRGGKLWSLMKMKMFMVMIKDSNEQIMICWSKLGLGEAYEENGD